MMAFYGTIVNSLAILLAGLIGSKLERINPKVQETVTYGAAAAIVVLGLQMIDASADFVVVLISLIMGCVIGEFLQIEQRIEKYTSKMERHLGRNDNQLSKAFLSASFLFVSGSMGIIGAIENAAYGDATTLLTKAVIDGCLSFVLAASLGVGVAFSSVSVLLYQGAFSALALLFFHLISPTTVTDLMIYISTIGGILVFMIGLNLFKLTKIRVSNFLPSLLVLLLIKYFLYLIQ